MHQYTRLKLGVTLAAAMPSRELEFLARLVDGRLEAGDVDVAWRGVLLRRAPYLFRGYCSLCPGASHPARLAQQAHGSRWRLEMHTCFVSREREVDLFLDWIGHHLGDEVPGSVVGERQLLGDTNILILVANGGSIASIS